MNIIAEVGNAHEGSLIEAEAYIRTAAEVNAWGVKFQRRMPDNDPIQEFREGMLHPQDVTRRDYWRRVGFSDDEWAYLIMVAGEVGIFIGISVFAEESAAWADRMGFQFIKVPLICNDDRFVSAVEQLTSRATFKMASTSLRATSSNWSSNIIRLACCARRPATYRQTLERFDSIKADGISSHCPDLELPIMAHAKGCQWFESHVIWDRRQRTPDAAVSLTMTELEDVCRATY
jgi:N-acetylneuraminate synthase